MRSLFALGGLLLVPRLLLGQIASTGAIQGKIVGQDSIPVAGAAVRADRAETGFVRETVTDAGGVFRLGFLAPGSYRVVVRRIGFRPAVLDRIAVTAGGVTSLTLGLTPTVQSLDSIVVDAPAVTIDVERTEFGTTISARELRLLPTPNDARNLVGFANGARPDQVFGGATAQANNYQLDGVAVNHPGIGGDLVQPSVSWIEEVQVRGLGAGAEHGNFQGGIINFVTKSGTNRREGAIRLFAENRRFNGSNLRLGEAGSEISDRLEFDGHVRGPLKRDRLFYALFAQVVSRDARVLNQVPLVGGDFVPEPPHDQEHRLLGKLTWQPSDRDAVTASLARFGTTGDRFGQTGFKSVEATQRLDAGSWLGSLAWQRTFSSRSFLEAKIAGYDGSDRRLPYGASDLPGVQVFNQVDPNEYQNAPFREQRDPASLSATVQWDVFQRLAGLEHHFKIGGEYGAGRWSYFRERNGGLTWRPGDVAGRLPPFDPTRPSTWSFNQSISSSWGGEVALDSRVQNNAVFLQDYVRLSPRLTASLGIRYGWWLGQLNTANGYQTVVKDAAAEPRLGLTYALKKDGSFVAKVHWGRYHQSMFAGFFDRAAGSSVYNNEERWEYRGLPFTDPATVFTLDDRDRLERQGLFRRAESIRLNETGAVENYHQPYIDQAVLGFEKSFGPRWRAEALYVNRRNGDMVGLIDENLASNYTTFYNLLVLDRFFRPFSIDGKPLRLKRVAVSNEDLIRLLNDQLANPGCCGAFLPPGISFADIANLRYQPDYLLTNLPDARREFDQVQVRVEARYPTWWLDVGATVTRLEGNLNTIVGADEYSGSSAGPYVRLNESFDNFGRLNNQSRLEIKARVGGNLRWGLSGGAFVTYLSGDYYTWTLNLSNLLYNLEAEAFPEDPRQPFGHGRSILSRLFETTTGQRIFLENRGSRRYPPRLSIDLHLERGFRVGSADLVATLDGFNVLAADAITEVQTSYNGETDPRESNRLASVRSRMPPRTIRVGAGVRF
ncbi:MAG: carboxypeptidase regulatory-like domain-containing protein [Gemmatimonadales bacterium]